MAEEGSEVGDEAACFEVAEVFAKGCPWVVSVGEDAVDEGFKFVFKQWGDGGEAKAAVAVNLGGDSLHDF